MEYLIGDFSKISRLGIKTLRYYHEISLLTPCRVDAVTGYRYYNEKNLMQVWAIMRLKEIHFSLTEIREIVNQQNPEKPMLQTMQQKLIEVNQQIESLEQVRERLEKFVNSESIPLIQPFAVEEKNIPELLVASIRFQGRYSDLGEIITHLFEVCGQNAVGAPFSLYYDDHPMEADADIEICVPVNKRVETTEISSRMLPGGRALSILHPGSYDQIWVSYQAMVDYWNSHHLRIALPSREIYLKGGNPSEGTSWQFLTEIQFLIKYSGIQ